MSVLKDTQYTLASPTFVGADGETPTDCASTPTAAVTRDDGTSLTAAVVTAAAGDGAYTAAITTTHTSQLDRLTVTWTGTAGSIVQIYTQRLEVAGGWYVTVPEVQAEPDLSTATVAVIRRKRDEFESLAENFCGVAFVPRYERETLAGDGTANLLLKWPLPRTLLSVTVDGVAGTLADYDVDPVYGLVKLSGTIPRSSDNARNVVVTYTHGHDFPPPDLKEACLAYLRSKITVRSAGIPNNAMDGSDQTRNWTYSAPGEDKPTGIPSVDEVLVRLSELIPGVA